MTVKSCINQPDACLDHAMDRAVEGFRKVGREIKSAKEAVQDTVLCLNGTDFYVLPLLVRYQDYSQCLKEQVQARDVKVFREHQRVVRSLFSPGPPRPSAAPPPKNPTAGAPPAPAKGAEPQIPQKFEKILRNFRNFKLEEPPKGEIYRYLNEEHLRVRNFEEIRPFDPLGKYNRRRIENLIRELRVGKPPKEKI